MLERPRRNGGGAATEASPRGVGGSCCGGGWRGVDDEHHRIYDIFSNCCDDSGANDGTDADHPAPATPPDDADAGGGKSGGAATRSSDGSASGSPRRGRRPSARRAAEATGGGAGAEFSVADWIGRNIPCVGAAAADDARATPRRGGDPERSRRRPRSEATNDTPSGERAETSWCDLSRAIPCPGDFIRDQGQGQGQEVVKVEETRRLVEIADHLLPPVSTAEQPDPTPTPTPTTTRTHSFGPGTAGNPNSSWLSGHLGLIQTPSSNHPIASSSRPSLVRSASLTKPPSFAKTPSNPQSSASGPSKSESENAPSAKPPRLRSPVGLNAAQGGTARGCGRRVGDPLAFGCGTGDRDSDEARSRRRPNGDASFDRTRSEPTVRPRSAADAGGASATRGADAPRDASGGGGARGGGGVDGSRAADGIRVASDEAPKVADPKNRDGDAPPALDASVDGGAVGAVSRRKVLWGNGKDQVLITANEDSTEVTKRENKKGNSSNSEDIGPFATYHDEIVTALIDAALRGNDHGAASTEEDDPCSELVRRSSSTADTAKSTPKKPSLTTPNHKSPHRSSFSTPKWKKNRSLNKLDHLNKMQKHDHKGSSDGKFQSKAKSNSALTSSILAAGSSLEKHPLDYFHPQCRLMKEKGSDKRKSQADDGRAPSAVGKEAVLEKLQEKLSMLGDIESGRFGKAAEMLQSDAVAFSIRGSADLSSGSALSRTESNATRDSAADSVQGTSKKRKAIIETRSLLTLRMGFVSMSYGILLQWDYASRMVELIVLRKMCREDFLERNDEHNVDSLMPVKTKSTKTTTSTESTASGTTVESQGSRDLVEGFTGMSLFPQLRSEPDQTPQSFLSVSVVNVKDIHDGCDLCLASRITGQNGTKSKEKHTVRPYIRFVLGKNEHHTKPAKLLPNNNVQYHKRHNNSCLLPMPKEEFRWFAGQEDLVVEVRDMLSSAASKNNRKSKAGTSSTKSSSKNEQSSPQDPILAVVTVPLSSVNIEDEGDKSGLSDAEECGGLAPWKNRKTKKHDHSSRDDLSSTNITLPLRMTCCPSAPFGSISLQITVKVPQKDDATAPTAVSSKKLTESSIAADQSIEIGAIARIMQGWVIYDSASADDERNPENSKASKSLQKKIRKQGPRWDKKWNPKTKRWSKLTLNKNSLSSSGRDISSEPANWFTFYKWGDEPAGGRR